MRPGIKSLVERHSRRYLYAGKNCYPSFRGTFLDYCVTDKRALSMCRRAMRITFTCFNWQSTVITEQVRSENTLCRTTAACPSSGRLLFSSLVVGIRGKHGPFGDENELPLLIKFCLNSTGNKYLVIMLPNVSHILQKQQTTIVSSSVS